MVWESPRVLQIISLRFTCDILEGIWKWSDGARMPLPSDPWHVWWEGEPDDDKGAEDCSVMTNYRFWHVHKLILDSYVWRDYNCHLNPQEIQGYVCESKIGLYHA